MAGIAFQGLLKGRRQFGRWAESVWASHRLVSAERERCRLAKRARQASRGERCFWQLLCLATALLIALNMAAI
ncbi:hypothetical protein L6Q21_00330 [Sandaracinobacter sp. RS1-74]|uniref:hypothetical protein n=1 Tax=Sandaracinobacteroides sayramensis TaxID=2913411 RepID=UPI001EDC8EF4|nr:hypothetical protein [Sandaracinobacteroides sayramensis]MCG2839422.1 hypothetical protein [Sandaracinobacteroides sayramensis]